MPQSPRAEVWTLRYECVELYFHECSGAGTNDGDACRLHLTCSRNICTRGSHGVFLQTEEGFHDVTTARRGTRPIASRQPAGHHVDMDCFRPKRSLPDRQRGNAATDCSCGHHGNRGDRSFRGDSRISRRNMFRQRIRLGCARNKAGSLVSACRGIVPGERDRFPKNHERLYHGEVELRAADDNRHAE